MTRLPIILMILATPLAVAESLPELAFEDIEGETVTLRWPTDSPMVLMVADRKASDHIDPWQARLAAEFPDRIAIRGVAKLDGVPSFARGMARKIVASKGATDILLDWEDALGEHVTYIDDQPLMVVVDANGRVIHQESGTLSEAGWSRISSAISGLLTAEDATDAPKTP